jgi:predicted Zn-dependent protease
MRPAARGLLALVALAAAAWLASGLAGAVDEARARRTGLDPGRAAALLDGARRGRPDGTVLPLEAAVLVRQGRAARAAALLRPLLREEPDNVTGWAVLSLALARSDPRGAAAARARAQALAPPAGPPR